MVFDYVSHHGNRVTDAHTALHAICHFFHIVTYCHDLSQPVLLPNLHSMQVLSQVQNFDNLIVPVVDSLKYLSPLGYDMLSCIHSHQGPVEGVAGGHVSSGSRAWWVGVSRDCRVCAP